VLAGALSGLGLGLPGLGLPAALQSGLCAVALKTNRSLGMRRWRQMISLARVRAHLTGALLGSPVAVRSLLNKGPNIARGLGRFASMGMPGAAKAFATALSSPQRLSTSHPSPF